MRIAICDDDTCICEKLYHFITDTYKDLDLLVDTYRSGEDFLSHTAAGRRYDILFLDIEMNRISGMKVAAEMKRQNLHTFIIFITSHEEFAPKGYEVAAFRFLVKPLRKAKIAEAIEAVKGAGLPDKTISVRNNTGLFRVYLNDILYFEAQNQMVTIYLRDDVLTHRENISRYAGLLREDGFCQIHRSYLINLRYVQLFNGSEVALNDGTKLPVSRLRAKEFGGILHQYIRHSAI